MSICHHHEADGYGLVCGQCAEDYTHRLEAQLAEAKREARREAFREAVKIAENMADELENCSDMRARNFLAVAEALRREAEKNG